MDKALRNTLRIVVTQARRILEEAIGELLQGRFGIHKSGMVEDAANMSHLFEEEHQHREQLFIHLKHIQVAGFKPGDAVAQLVREIAFTHLNRLCAYKMMEKRGLIRESVSRGIKSNGFLFYLAEHPNDEQLWSGGQQDVAYRHFLTWLGGTLSEEIGVLFSPHDSASRLFPPYHVLERVLVLLNSEELKDIWVEDETIGWVYQYFTPKELRDQARKESRSPRNSYELAFRNQFYTPRYVVQFLTENTLGRIWYEMRQGETRLKEQCPYLVRRPDEVFFTKADMLEVAEAERWLQGEDVPEPDPASLAYTVNGYNRHEAFTEATHRWMEQQLSSLSEGNAKEIKTQDLLDLLFLCHRYDRFSEGTLDARVHEITLVVNALRKRVHLIDRDNLTQEELLRAPFFVPYREKKDPRELRILDPACGSGHFLLYCFDLLTTIYEEAYGDPDLGPALQRDYPTLADLKKDVPVLILAHNLHGIDIDLRATQIAALALWLRAQRAYQELKLYRAERPRITRSNIVCAEPMPGEKDMLAEFIHTLQPAMLGDMVRVIFEKMQLASEAGSLLKIEEEIREAVLEAKQRWMLLSSPGQLALWSGNLQPERVKLLAETGITNKDFWNGAEARVIDALHRYAQAITNGNGLARQLFAGDVVQGFAFIDICQKQFDVVLMNPPFGEYLTGTETYIKENYPTASTEIHTSFLQRGTGLLGSNGAIGILCSRTFLTISSAAKFREDFLLTNGSIQTLADFGNGVLDSATVETCAISIHKHTQSPQVGIYFRLIEASEKQSLLSQRNMWVCNGYLSEECYLLDQLKFHALPNSPIAYWIEEWALNLFQQYPSTRAAGYKIAIGCQTGDNERFLRLRWEVNPEQIGVGRIWIQYSKGGDFSPFYSDLELVLKWENEGQELKEAEKAKGRSIGRSITGIEYHFRSGLTYPLVTNKGLSVRPLPAGSICDNGGPGIFSESETLLWLGLTIFNSTIFEQLVRYLTSSRHW